MRMLDEGPLSRHTIVMGRMALRGAALGEKSPLPQCQITIILAWDHGVVQCYLISSISLSE